MFAQNNMPSLLVPCLAFLLVLIGQLKVARCGTYTVTDEAWFEIFAQDKNGSGQSFRGNFTVALFGETAPMTTLNFVGLVKGVTKRNKKIKSIYSTLGYKHSPIHRIVPDLLIQMGDITKGDGTGGISIYGDRFNDEEFILRHRSPGWVSMANHGPNTNSAQFFILLTKARWLDGKHVVFGKVIRGFDTVYTLSEVPTNTDNAVPLSKVMVINCGLNKLTQKYDLTASQLDSTKDL